MLTPRTAELTAIISSSISTLNNHLTKSNHSLPSFDISSPPNYPSLPPEIAGARITAIEATKELHALLLGPTDHVLGSSGDYFDFLGLQFIHRYMIATVFPPGEEMTFEDIAAARDLDVNETKRFLRLAMTNYVFTEPREGVVGHSACSKVLAENRYAAAWLGHAVENVWPPLPRVLDASEKWPGSEQPNETGYVLMHRKGLTPFAHLEDNLQAAQQFSDGMNFFSLIPGLEPEHLLEAFNFSSLQEDSIFVDVGGSHGVISILVARAFPNIRCIVQDLPPTIAKVAPNLPSDLAGRVLFMEHDFFEEQPVQNADVYFFRWVFHDWSDLYGVKILRALIPVLKSGAKDIISEMCMPEYGQMPLAMQKLPRSMDMNMKAQFNGKERDAKEWVSLLKRADPRFTVDTINRPVRSKLSFIIATWSP